MAKRQKFDLDDALDAHPVQRQRNGISTLIGSEAITVEPGTETELSLDETDELQRCEQIVERGLKTFFEVGAALMRVRDLRLYRVEYHTFENYCQERWGMTRRHANRLVESAEVVHNVGPIGPTPDNEAQARPLAKLKDPEQQREAWQRAVATAAGKITAAHVEQVVKEMIGQSAAADAFPSADETEVAPAQQEVIIEQAGEDGLFPDGEPAPVAAATSPAAAPAQGDWLHLAVQTDEEEDAAAPSGEEEPWPDNLFEIEARLAEEGWERTSESETRIYYQRGNETLHLVKPPEPNVVQLRLVAHASEDMEQVMTWLHQQIGAEFPRRPASSRLPKYPERRRVYGVVAASEQRIANGHEPADAAALQDEVVDLRQRLADVQTILEEYQQHITRAQKYKATSDRGEAVSPLLRLVERVALTIQDIERKGGQKE
jgi:hypothetical protein